MSEPDPEYGMREYLRNYDALFSTSVHVGLPTNTPVPYIEISRIGGGEDPGEAPIDLALLQFDVWGKTKAEAHTWKSLMRTAFRAIRTDTLVKTDTVVLGVTIVSDIWLPDPADDTPRYVVTAQVVCREP